MIINNLALRSGGGKKYAKRHNKGTLDKGLEGGGEGEAGEAREWERGRERESAREKDELRLSGGWK